MPLHETCAALRKTVDLPVYWATATGILMLADAVRRMRDDGIRRAVAFATSALGSSSGCRQYLENIEHARAAVGPRAPEVVKIRPFSGHPLFIEAMTDPMRSAFDQLPGARIVFTAHSVDPE